MRRPIQIPPEVQALLDVGAPVAVGVSGGKDSHAVAWALAAHLKDYSGPKLLIHADLGSVEWLDSWPACERIAEATGWELISCTRPAGGMMERWESRWQSSIRRYCELKTVAVVLPWSTPAMRFCTSELKVSPITSALKKRFGRVPMLNVTGVRAEESSARAKQPVCATETNLPPGSLVWRPIHEWLLEDVWDAIAASGVAAHGAYDTFGSSRVSCRFCILANEADLRASLTDPAAEEIYRRMCELELKSAFAFQGTRWLTSLAPELVPDGAARLLDAQQRMLLRRDHEVWLPKHLQFTKGWPHCVPTLDESESLAFMRQQVCQLYGWESPYLTTTTVRDRYQELWELKQEHEEKLKQAAENKRLRAAIRAEKKKNKRLNTTTMKTSHIAMAAFAGLFIIVLMLIFSVIGTVNSYSRLEVKAKAVQTDNTNVLDNTRKAIREAAQVSDTEVEALTKIITGYAEARGPNEGGGDNNTVSIGMVTEAVPGITSIETLKRLQNIIIAGRKEWQASQTRLIEVKRQADEKLAVFPGSMILGMMGKKEIAIVVVTSSETEDNFASGKDDKSWIETPNTEK